MIKIHRYKLITCSTFERMYDTVVLSVTGPTRTGWNGARGTDIITR